MGSELQARGKKAAASVSVASHRLAGKQEGCEWNCLDCEKKLTLMDKILMVWSTSHEFTSVLLPSQLVSWIEHFHEEWTQDATIMQDTGFTIQCLSASRYPLGQRDEEQ